MNAESMGGGPESLKSFEVVSFNGLESALEEGPDFVIPKLIPVRNVTMLSANGGAGKTQLALTLAAHAAAGHAWSGLPITSCEVLYVSLEEEGRDIRRRLRTIIDVFGLDEALVRERLHTVVCAKEFLALAIESHGPNAVQPTELMKELNTMARGKRFIIIDNSSIAFSGNENDRRQVSSFMSILVRLARENDAAVLLLAHVDKAAVRNNSRGSAYSGSTAWHNSCRSRLALVIRPGYVELTQEKLNLAATAESIRLEWADGVLMPSTAGVLHRQEERDSADDKSLLDVLDRRWEAGSVVPASRRGKGNVGSTLLPELGRGWSKTRLYAALGRLEQGGLIKQEPYRSMSRHERWHWVRI